MTRSLERRFARRMALLAALAGVSVAALPPLTFYVIAWNERAEQARIYAEQLAAAVRAEAYRQPALWRYNAGKLLQAIEPFHEQRDVAGIVVADCAGRTLASSGDVRLDGPRGWARATVRESTAAWIGVSVPPAEPRRRALLAGALSCLMGAALGALLFFFPRSILRELRGVSRRVIDVQEEERRRIARDLHDGLGQAITGVQLELERAATTAVAPTRAALDAAVAGCRAAITELRRVVHELRPVELEGEDLPRAMRAYAERFEARSGIATSFRLSGDARPAEGVAIALMRILQEALTNVARHARAREVGIVLRLEREASLEVTDDGVGLGAAADGGAGLLGIRERCAFLGGTMELTSAAGGGTRLHVRLPIEGTG